MEGDNSEFVDIVVERIHATYSKKLLDVEIERVSKAAKIVADFMRELDPSDPSLAFFADQMLKDIHNDAMYGAVSRGGSLLCNLSAYILATSDITPSQDAARKLLKIIQGGSIGGKRAAKNRAEFRKNVRDKIKKLISERGYWDDWKQNQQSITDDIWSEIEQAMNRGQGWEGISNDELQKAQTGWQTVYDVVKETDHR